MGHRRVQAPPQSSSFTGFRYPLYVILVAVRWYLRYALSYRDVEELLAERGVIVDHVTIYRWVQRFTPLLIVGRPESARSCWRLSAGAKMAAPVASRCSPDPAR
jgi:transposase-like protein